MPLDPTSLIDVATTIVMGYMAFTGRRLVISVEKLNIKMAEIVNELQHHDWRLSRLEDGKDCEHS